MKVIYYRKRSGKEPVRDFIEKLGKKSQIKIETCLKFLQRGAKEIENMVFRQIKGKLWEIKIKTPDGGYRIFYTMLSQELMMLLHAYKKQSQKAPQKEIEIAIKRMKEVRQIFNIK